jgi:hypothetical protein
MTDINPSDVAAEAASIVHTRAIQRKRAKTTAAATVLADVLELLEENPRHPVAVTAAAILSRRASTADVVAALREIYPDLDQELTARPPTNVIQGTAVRRIPILKADGSEDGSVAVDDTDEQLRLESQGYHRVRRNDGSVAYQKTDPAGNTRPQPALPATPPARLPVYDKRGVVQTGTITLADGMRQVHDGDLKVMPEGATGDQITGFRKATLRERF